MPRPVAQPLRPATAAVVVAAALVVAIAAGLVFGLSERPLMAWAAGSMAREVAWVLTLTGLWALEAGLSLALLILAILVVVRGVANLRRGGIFILVAAAMGLFGMFGLSFETYGDPPGLSTVEIVFTVLEVLGGLVRIALLLAGGAIMVRSVQRLRRERGARPRA
ncbi:hypothetical protein ACFQS2_09630 [Brachybacterium sp. GCM10030267]|uniref:hypothetical protein n=1 Tax=Brachybacterium sp. GCM10030267 TaxID=3273381 RepID=UPI00361B917C